MKLLKSSVGDVIETSIVQNDETSNIVAGGKMKEQYITPVCKDNVLPTLTAQGAHGSPRAMFSTGTRPCPGVVEIWTKNKEGYENKKEIVNRNKESINKRVSRLASNEYVRSRKLTPEEVLKLMGVDTKYVKRMLSPYAELKTIGFSEEEINRLLTVNGRLVRLTDKSIYERAGNAIVVDVLYYLLESLLVPPKKRIKQK